MTDTTRQIVRNLTDLAAARNTDAFLQTYRAAVRNFDIACDLQRILPSWNWEAAYSFFAAKGTGPV